MKVRILDQSIRFRIRKDELKLLSENKPVFSSTQFPSGKLLFKVQAKHEAHNIDWNDNLYELTINQGEINHLHHSDAVSITFTQGNLEVLFEKDFKCLSARDANNPNLYTNPNPPHSES